MCLTILFKGLKDNMLSRCLGGNGCGIIEKTQTGWNYNPSFGNGSNGIGRGTSCSDEKGNKRVCILEATTATPTVNPILFKPDICISA